MIYGIGVDQVDLNRVRKLLNKSKTKFEKRCFTQNEIIYANRFNDPAKRLGARFAAKEAVMKSLGKGWRQLGWKILKLVVEVNLKFICMEKQKNWQKSWVLILCTYLYHTKKIQQ